MSATTQERSPKSKRALPLPDADLAAVVDRLRNIATTSCTSLLVADGPPQPDFRLLDLCAEGLHAARQHDRCKTARDELWSNGRSWTDRDRDHHAMIMDEETEWEHAIIKAARAAAKIKATTPPGIYAKALLVRSSATGAAVLSYPSGEDRLARMLALREAHRLCDGDWVGSVHYGDNGHKFACQAAA